MKYKEMTVWSAGENAKRKKFEFVMGIFIFIMWFIMCYFFFTKNISNNPNEKMKLFDHILCGFCMSFITGIVGFLGYVIAKLAKDAIKRNAKFTIQLYEFDEFMKYGKVPDDKIVVFSSNSGFVVCDKKDKRLYEDWICWYDNKYFHQFEKIYDKYKGEKRKIIV